ncbi:MAG: tetraacyldisaccharide 4'-kinase [Planctomycetaceae bacterium]
MLARAGLLGLSGIYGLGVCARNLAYELRIKKVHSAAVPVISVGNLTTGGTGKTPFVAFLANWYRERGLRVALLSRGYGARDGGANDEKQVLDALCPGIPHLQHADRVASAANARRDHGAQILILDDGFQHRRLSRELDIVLIDALCPWGYGRLLPRGLLREPLSALRRADLVVLTRADQCTPEERQAIVNRVAAIRGDNKLVEVAYPPVSLINSAAETAQLQSLRGKQIAAFCGIGNPDAFRRTLETCGFQLSGAAEQTPLPYREGLGEGGNVDAFLTFPDHHQYGPRDLDQLADLAQRTGAAAIVTTQKDLVKIRATQLGGKPLWAIQIGTKIVAGADVLAARLEEIIRPLSA